MKRGKSKSDRANELRTRAQKALKERHDDNTQLQVSAETLRQVHELQVHQIELEMQNHELENIRDALETSLERYTMLYDFAPIGYFTLDRNGTIAGLNLTAAKLLGSSRADLVGKPLATFIAETYQATLTTLLNEVFASTDDQAAELLLNIAHNSMFVHIEVAAEPSGNTCFAVVVDISARKWAENALRESEERYRLLVEQSPDAIFIENESMIVFANTSALRLFRAKSLSELHGQSLLSLISPKYQADAGWAIQSADETGISNTLHQQASLLDGNDLDVAVTWLAFAYQGKRCIQMVMRDISERQSLENQLSHQVLHDALTGLPNRGLLIEQLTQAIAVAKREKQNVIVSFIDLDHFKWINDTLGHDVGDELLRILAARMAGCLREVDTVARLGGDEFVLVLGHAIDGSAGMEAIDRIMQAISQPMLIRGHDMAITCSAGCSTYPDDGHTAEELLRFADAAMYHAKESGRNRLQVYDKALSNRLEERMQLQDELRHAIDGKQLRLEYQPEIDLCTGEIVCVEALLRWQHPRLGPIAPSRFIPIAEETGLIEAIGAWVIESASAQAAEWRERADLHRVSVAVNLSAKQLGNASLEHHIARCLFTARLNPIDLELELTESSSMESPEHIFPLMHRLKGMGLSIAIDDFGTGFSNMRYLQRLPVDKLKLDGSFVREITTDSGSLAISEAIITIAHQLGLKVVAEMVETEAQVLLLRARGCDLAQGHYFSRAVSAQACAALLKIGSYPFRSEALSV